MSSPYGAPQVHGAVAEATRLPTWQSEVTFLERLAGQMGAAAGVTALFGEPVVGTSVTLIPVARVRWGFGGGGGRRIIQAEHGSDSGLGGGGGIDAMPLGFIEVRDGAAVFKRISPPFSMLSLVPVIVSGGLAALLLLRGLRQIIRG